jgi:polyribonucleotide nucleotidyltransferase
MHILSEMLRTQAEVATELSPYAPLIMSLMVPEDKIRAVIGKGGETIQRIQAEHDVNISIDDTGMTSITAKTQEGGKAALAEIKEILWTPEV